MEEADQIQGLNILENQDQAKGFAREKEASQPAKQKVTAFKNRVFGLLMLFVEKSKDLTPLAEGLSQELFLKQPQRMRQLVTALLNHGALDGQRLKSIADNYKTLLLFKNKKRNPAFAEDFVRVLRRLMAEDEEQSRQVVRQMLQTCLTRRKSSLPGAFFSFLVRRIPAFKQVLIEKLLQIEENIQLRPAQGRLLQKMKRGLLNKQRIKEQMVEQEQDDE